MPQSAAVANNDGVQFRRSAAAVVRRSLLLPLQGKEITGMLTPQELAATRFAMSAPPQPGGETGVYEEQVARWVAEKSFFRGLRLPERQT
jgi:hypothetical protein